jgi:Ca-activated chloride channel family protein
VIDASGSMESIDTHIRGERRSRLDLARQVVARFAANRAAEGDRVALVVFGESAFTPCPLTSDGAHLADALQRVEAGVAGSATAIGDALALAVKRAAAGSDTSIADSPVAGRVIVLLTDGRNNAGSIPVEIAAQLARGEGVRVHTVGIGTAGHEVPFVRAGPSANYGVELARHDIDEAMLMRIAEETGGRYFPARSSDQLDAIYREIDALERVARRLPPRIRSAPQPEPFLAGAGFCLLIEIGGARIFRRRIP